MFRCQKMLDFAKANGHRNGFMETSWTEAIAEWRTVVGAEHVLTSDHDLAPYRANASGLRRGIPAVVRPVSTAEVQEVVRVANRRHTPLYPISTGRNLGLGSRLPVRDDQAVLDLGRMNRILHVSVDNLYAVVEPGVTQGQLAAHLAAQGAPLILNVTGASRHTSMIGNTLERGIGYFASRADSLTGMEIVLGDGRILRTGFGHIDGVETTHLYRHGIGPDISGLFSQSNFGIVTSAGVPLLPRQDVHLAAVCSVAEDRDLPALVDAMRDLRRRGVVRTVVHIGNRHRTHLAVGSEIAEALAAQGVPTAELPRRVAEVIRAEGFGAWSALWGIMGTRGEVRMVKRELRRVLKSRGKLVFIDNGLLRLAEVLVSALRFTGWGRRKALILPGVRYCHGLVQGTPADQPMKGLHWALGRLSSAAGADPDVEGWGLLYCLPFMPFDGSSARELVALTDEVYGRHGFTPYITFNTVDDRAMEAVINLAFDAKSDAETARSHLASRELHDAVMRRGWMPYRVGIQDMSSVVRGDDEFWRVARELKRVFDPNGIIAPGRYNLV